MEKPRWIQYSLSCFYCQLDCITYFLIKFDEIVSKVITIVTKKLLIYYKTVAKLCRFGKIKRLRPLTKSKLRLV